MFFLLMTCFQFLSASETEKNKTSGEIVSENQNREIKKASAEKKSPEENTALNPDKNKDGEKDFLKGLSGKMKNDSKTEKSNYNYFLITGIMLFVGVMLLYYKKKRSGNSISGDGKLMKTVEIHHLGLKEKLVLMQIAGQYVLLFIKDREVVKITDYCGEDARRISNFINCESEKSEQKDNLKKNNCSQKKSSSSEFGKKLESLLEKESQKRDGTNGDIENDMFSSINRLRKMRLK